MIITAQDCWRARGFNLLVWYAKTCGIADQDIAEADWVGDWVKRHHNRLRYDPRVFKWRWHDEPQE